MTQDEIMKMAGETYATATIPAFIRMAREAGLPFGERGAIPLWDKEVERLVAIARADERKRFALECIDLVALYGGPVDLEAAIRARGQA